MRPWALAGPPTIRAHVSCSACLPSRYRIAAERRVDEALTTGLKKLGSFRLPSLSRFVRSLIFGWPPVGYVSRPPSRVFELRDYLRGCLGLPRIAPARCGRCRGRLGSRKRVLVLATCYLTAARFYEGGVQLRLTTKPSEIPRDRDNRHGGARLLSLSLSIRERREFGTVWVIFRVRREKRHRG